MPQRYALATAALTLWACSTIAAADETKPSVARGRDIFMKVGCYHCHGTHGQGSGAGLKLAPDPLPTEAIAQFIRATTSTMPAYSEHILSDSQIADIAAYLGSIPAARSPDAIPALKSSSQHVKPQR